MPEITVYGKPDCQQCRATTRYLDAREIAYTYADVTEDDAARDTVALLGYQALPVIVVGDMHWQGFRPDRLMAAAVALTTDTAALEVAAEQYLTEGADCA